MPSKRKRAAAKNKTEAPPAKGEKDIKSEKTATVSQDQGATGLFSWSESARPQLLKQWEQSLNNQRSEIVRLLDSLQRPEHDGEVQEGELFDKFPKFLVQLRHYRWLWQTGKESYKKGYAEWSQFRESRDEILVWMCWVYHILWGEEENGEDDGSGRSSTNNGPVD